MAVTTSIYNNAKLDIFNSNVALAADTIKVALLNASATFSAAHTVYSDVSGNEVANGNGYTTGGATLASKVVSGSSGTVKFDADDVAWTAAGGSIGPAAAAVIYDTTLSNKLLGYINFGGSLTAGDGTQLKITFDATGIFVFS